LINTRSFKQTGEHKLRSFHLSCENHNTVFDITYGRTTENVRNQQDPVNTYIKIKHKSRLLRITVYS